MPYNPGISDQRGAMAMQGLGQIAQLNYQGAASFGQGLGGGLAQAGSALGGGIAQAGQDFAQTMAKQRVNLGKMEALGTAGLLAPEELDSLSKIKDPDKLSGALSVVEDSINYQRRNQLMANEYDLRAGLQAAEHTMSRTGETTTLTDPVTGKQFGGYYGNSGQVLLLPQEKAAAATGFTKVDLGGGAFAYVDAEGRAIPKSSVQTPDMMLQTEITGARKELADAAAQEAQFGRGAVKKTTTGIWPFSSTSENTYGSVADAARAKLKALETGTGTSTGGGEVQSAPQFREGQIVVQNGVRYQFTNGKFLPVK